MARRRARRDGWHAASGCYMLRVRVTLRVTLGCLWDLVSIGKHLREPFESSPGHHYSEQTPEKSGVCFFCGICPPRVRYGARTERHAAAKCCNVMPSRAIARFAAIWKAWPRACIDHPRPRRRRALMRDRSREGRADAPHKATRRRVSRECRCLPRVRQSPPTGARCSRRSGGRRCVVLRSVSCARRIERSGVSRAGPTNGCG